MLGTKVIFHGDPSIHDDMTIFKQNVSKKITRRWQYWLPSHNIHWILQQCSFMCGRRTRSHLSTSNPKLLQINNRKVSLLIIMQKYVKQDLIIIIIYAKDIGRHAVSYDSLLLNLVMNTHLHWFPFTTSIRLLWAK